MNIAIILAAGNGTRFDSDTPKQFLKIHGKELLMYSVEAFCNHTLVDLVLLVIHPLWEQQATDILANYPLYKNLDICCGGDSRNQSIENSLKYLDANYKLQANDVILTHDSARPFVTAEIITANILAMKTHAAANTAINSQDTVFEAQGNEILQIPRRETMYLSQTPQTFLWGAMHDIYFKHIYDSEIFDFVDASTLALKCGYKIAIVKGDKKNIKITTLDDLDKLI